MSVMAMALGEIAGAANRESALEVAPVHFVRRSQSVLHVLVPVTEPTNPSSGHYLCRELVDHWNGGDLAGVPWCPDDLPAGLWHVIDVHPDRIGLPMYPRGLRQMLGDDLADYLYRALELEIGEPMSPVELPQYYIDAILDICKYESKFLYGQR